MALFGRQSRTSASMALALALACPTAALAWQPTKPIQLIIGFAAGGGSDVIARSIVQGAQECFGQPLVIVNKAGAAGTIGAQEVANSPPDGHTLLLGGGSESTSVPAHRQTPYDPVKDFRPIIRLSKGSQYFVVSATSPYKTMKDVVEAARAKPGQIAHGSSGVGSLAHSIPLLLGRRADVKFKHVPFQGGAPAIQAVLAGQIDFTIAGPDEMKGQVEAGTLRVIGVAGAQRTQSYPDVATLKELGYDVVVENMKGWVAPAGLPDDIYQFHHDCWKKAMDHPAYKDFQARQGEGNAYLDGPTFQQQMSDLFKSIQAALKEGS